MTTVAISRDQECSRCEGRGFYFDSDGHGGQSWKRPCMCRPPFTEPRDAATEEKEAR